MNGHNKPVTTTTPRTVPPSSPLLRQNSFQAAIHSKGYDCHIEQAMKCPCSDKATGQARTSCNNCNGTGWFFLNKKETRAVFQGMARKEKSRNWSDVDEGTISISLKPEDKIGYMDRIVVLDQISTFSQVIHMRDCRSETPWGFFTYYPLSIIEVRMFNGDNEMLKQLTESEYSIDENKIRLSTIFNLKNIEKFTLSIRYEHNPTFHILDITREHVMNRKKKCDGGDVVLQDFPIHCIGKRAHYLLDYPDVDGSSVFDNSSI